MDQDAPLPHLPLGEAPSCIAGLTRGQILTLVGTDTAALRIALEHAADQPRLVLQLDLPPSDALVPILDRVIDDLADLALALWPNWYPGATLEPSTLPNVRQPWRRAANRMAATGRRPRFRRVPRQIEFAQLLLAIEPGGLVLLAELDPTGPALQVAALIDALVWCARQGAAMVIAARRLPGTPSCQRILYGARSIAKPSMSVVERLITPSGERRQPTPHPADAIHRRVDAALRRDPELGDLFEGDGLVPIDAPDMARVDLLWREGRVVVELDGPDCRGEPRHGIDRHRDYELLVAGYLVLHLTETEVDSNLSYALEKIRRVVGLRKGSE